MEQQNKIKSICDLARGAARSASLTTTGQRNAALLKIADVIAASGEEILAANLIDVKRAEAANLPKMLRARLRLERKNIDDLCEILREVAHLAEPVGTVRMSSSGIEMRRIRVPLGVVAFAYECRPDLTVRAPAYTIKTGNAAILCGGSHTANTDVVLVGIFRTALGEAGLSPDLLSLIEATDNTAPEVLAGMRGDIDLFIIYGNSIQKISDAARIPVIETGPGNCHLYIDHPCDIERAVKVAVSSKCTRPWECDSVETLLVHKDAAPEFLPALERAAEPYHIEYRGCPKTREYLPAAVPAAREDWATEYCDCILAVKVVDSLEEAIEHINLYGTGYGEAIMTLSTDSAERFWREIDAAAVYVNTSTRASGVEFEDGIGSSSQKYHVRGPLGMSALTTDKYLISGGV